jgi:N-methylhydantoinase B
MTEPYRIELQLLASALASISEEMGAALIRSAYSANIKERRDCSTAVFDGAGRMVSQAEHIPVHLGAMPDSVAAVMELEPRPGDMFILNDPFRGGTHLPDITVVAPVAGPLGGSARGIFGFVAARAHHADVGGAEPGSMPAESMRLEDEGVVIPPTRFVTADRIDEGFMDAFLAQVRRPDERRGDIRAQIGACRIGQKRLLELWQAESIQGENSLADAMDESITYGLRRMRAAIAGFPDGVYTAEDYLERGDRDLLIAVKIEVRGEEIFIDFAGTSPQEEGNLNCPLAVTRSACYFVLRAVSGPDIPANAGAMMPVHITAPKGCLVNAAPPAAVAAGNVETSQRIADVLVLALSAAMPLPAQGQGTMNNITLGSDAFSYYETIGGGAGGCPQRPGASGIHLGMTNTLNTPVEALETGFPMRVERYELRRGSGGAGVHRGGDGVIRELKMLQPARLSLLSDRRRHGPAGAAGGGAGLPGRNLVNGKEVGAKVTMSLGKGDTVSVETPGGGGYGKPV